MPLLASCQGLATPRPDRRDDVVDPPRHIDPVSQPPSEEQNSPCDSGTDSRGELFAAPDFSKVLRFVAGLRPYRRPGVRLETELLEDGRPLVHHYGHGGGGVTVSWGTAEIAARLVERVSPPPCDAVVLGAGVIGLTTAAVLRERGYGVRIMAREFLSGTTSYLAGAQWAPSWVNVHKRSTEGGGDSLSSVLRVSHRRFAQLEGGEWGITRRPNFAVDRGSAVFKIPSGLFPKAQRLDRLPFSGPDRSGWVQETFLVEPPVYLARLQEQLAASGVVFEQRSFVDRRELVDIGGHAVIDCLGLGAKALFGDRRLVPIRGQLVHLQPGDYPYLLSHWGYVFPRKDAVILGGTFEKGVKNAAPNVAACGRILQRHKRFFGA